MQRERQHHYDATGGGMQLGVVAAAGLATLLVGWYVGLIELRSRCQDVAGLNGRAVLHINTFILLDQNYLIRR
jgi:hypothetical protein